MGLAEYDSYAEQLAVLGGWNPSNIFAKDLAEQVRLTAGSNIVAAQGIQILGKVWTTLPPEIRSQMGDRLESLAVDLLEQTEMASESIPVIGQIIAAGLDGALKIVAAAKITKAHKVAKSNRAHGEAQSWTIRTAVGTGVGKMTAWADKTNYQAYRGGLYTSAPVFDYAKFIKVRWGGDFDRKPCFARPGGERDAIFMGAPSAKGKGCITEMRRKSTGKNADSFGPFQPKCGRHLGLSASLWPWWSAAYAPEPLSRWGTHPDETFQVPPSPDTNAQLVAIQTAMMTDPMANMRASFRDVREKTARFHSWWAAAGGHRMRRISGGIVQDGETKKIDASKQPGHSLSDSAGSYWYYDPDGYVQAYEGQLGLTDIGSWGIKLPPGDPADLGVTIEQHNAVIFQRAAFAQRRLSTLRTPDLVKAIVTDTPGGILGLDRDGEAQSAILFSRSRSEPLLPYPGASSPKAKRMVFGKANIVPRRAVMAGGDLAGDGDGKGIGLILLAVLLGIGA